MEVEYCRPWPDGLVRWRDPTRIPEVRDGRLEPVEAGGLQIAVGAPAWFAWLAGLNHAPFAFRDQRGSFTARRRWYWYAYRTRAGVLHRGYLGPQDELTPKRLATVAWRLGDTSAEPGAKPEQAGVAAQTRFSDLPPAPSSLLTTRFVVHVTSPSP
jgi:hypothetical protein